MRLLDVRHEQTAAFAAEATGKLTRVPGLAVLTAGPGVTNGISAIAQAQFAGSPMVVVGGRAPPNRWGSGALQEIDHLPIVSPVAKQARTLNTAGDVAAGMDDAFTVARSSHRGPVFVDIPMDEFFNSVHRHRRQRHRHAPRARRRRRRADRRPARRVPAPLLILGTDVWADHAEEAALRFVEALGIPTLTNGMGRGLLPGGHPLLVTKARGAAINGADLVVVVGTPARLPPRLRHLRRHGRNATARSPRSCTSPTPPARSPAHAELAASVAGDLSAVLDGLQAAVERGDKPDWSAWADQLADVGQGDGRARHRAAHRRGRPDPPGPHLRRAGPAARRRRGRDRRRRRLRQLRRQVRRAQAPRRLARPRSLRLPRRRPRRGDRGPARPPERPGRPAARRRRGRLLADGRRHPGPPRPAGRHGDGQQLRVGPGEGPDADALRLRRRRPTWPSRRRTTRSSRPSAAPARRSPTRSRSARRSTAPSTRACPTSSTSSPTSRRPTRAAPSGSEVWSSASHRPDEHAAVGDADACAAYDRSLSAPSDPYRRAAARRRAARRGGASCGWRSRRRALLGCVTYCPPGSPWRELGRDRRGRVPDARRPPRRPRPRRGHGAGRPSARNGRASTAPTAWCCRRCAR